MDRFAGLVVDTSIWINLLATQRIWQIIECLPISCATPEQVICEVLRDPISHNLYPVDDHPLRGRADIEIVTLQGQSLDLFFELVVHDAISNLGDGEAASIAIAATRGWAVALDERKARRLVRERFPEVQLISSFELLRLPVVERALGIENRRMAAANAERYGRMHEPHDLRAATRKS